MAVPLAVSFGRDPGWSFIFALTLCIGSVLGGLWVTVRNPAARVRSAAMHPAARTGAAAVIAINQHLVLTLAGAAVVSFFLASLGTFYSLTLDTLSRGIYERKCSLISRPPTPAEDC